MTQATESVTDAREAAVKLLADADRIVVMAHVNPDADAIGASVGFARGLQTLGKNAQVALSDPVPEYASFLVGTEGVLAHLPEDADLLVCVDAADIERIGSLYTDNVARFQRARVLNIDHHRTNPHFGTVNVVDPAASSTSEICLRVLQEMDAHLDADTATALLFGIMGDTGSFQNGATTPGSLHTAAELVALGADSQRIAFYLFERKRFVAARLWGKVLANIRLDRERRIVIGYLSQDMLEEGATIDETEGIAEYMRGIQEADVVILLKENEDGSMRVSMRSRPDVDVSEIAAYLDGGGHRQAAGCTVAGPIDKSIAILVDAYDHFHPK